VKMLEVTLPKDGSKHARKWDLWQKLDDAKEERQGMHVDKNGS